MNGDSVLRIVAQCRLDATTKCVAIALALMVNGKTHEARGASLNRIALYAGLSKPTVIAKLGQLIQDGAVRRLEDQETPPGRESSAYVLAIGWFKKRAIESSEAGVFTSKAALLEHPISKAALLVKTLETGEPGTFTSKASLLNRRSSKAALLVKVPVLDETGGFTSQMALPEHLSSKAALPPPEPPASAETEPPANAPARDDAPARPIVLDTHRGSGGEYRAPGVVGTQDTGACDRAIPGAGHEHPAPSQAPATRQSVVAMHPGGTMGNRDGNEHREGDQEKCSIDLERSTPRAQAILGPAPTAPDPAPHPQVATLPTPAPIADALGRKTQQIAPGIAQPALSPAGSNSAGALLSGKSEPVPGPFLAPGPSSAFAKLAVLSEAAGGALTWIGTPRYPPIGNVDKEPVPQVLSAFVSRLDTTRPADNVLRCMGTVIKNKRCFPLSKWTETAIDLSRIVSDNIWQRIYNEALAMIAQRLRAIGAREGEPLRPWHPSGLPMDDSEIGAAFFRKTLDPKDWPGWDRLKM